MPAKIAILIAQKLADERTRKIIITIVAVVLSIIFLLVAGLQAIIALFTITLSTFLTEDTSLVGQTVALMDEARDAYVDEQMAEYRQRTDRNGNEYRNVILQWENGFSNNDKEVLTIVSCYYEQDWETDMSALACWVALKSVSFSTRERGPYSCGGCMSRKVCDGHPDGNGGTYHHSDDLVARTGTAKAVPLNRPLRNGKNCAAPLTPAKAKSWNSTCRSCRRRR